MLTKCSLRYAAVASSSNDSCAITWHQWQAAYPTLSSTGTLRRRASSNAAGPTPTSRRGFRVLEEIRARGGTETIDGVLLSVVYGEQLTGST